MDNINHITLDIILIICVLSQIIKLGDFIFLPEQHEKIKTYFNNLSIKLNAINPFTLIRKFSGENYAMISYIFSTIIILGYLIYAQFISEKQMLETRYLIISMLFIIFGTLGLSIPYFCITNVSYSLPQKIFGGEVDDDEIYEWLYADGNFVSFFLRFCILLSGTSLVVFLLYLVVNLISPIIENNKFLMVIFLLVMAVPMFIVFFWVVGFLPICLLFIFVFLIRVIIYLVYLILKICQFIVVRIAQFNKGPIAAISLIFTAILAIIEFIIRNK